MATGRGAGRGGESSLQGRAVSGIDPTVEVVTAFAPRQHASNWAHFLELLTIQRQSALHHGHRWTVVSDQKRLQDHKTMHVELPRNLMRALITAQVLFFKQWRGDHPVVFLDVDCLVARNLAMAFDGSFDIAVTNRGDNKQQPINNGAMYFAPVGTNRFAVELFERTLGLCAEDCAWGDDQVALARALAPMPEAHGVFMRSGARVGFLSMKTHNVAPVMAGVMHKTNPFVVHFKGKQAKEWMGTYARRFVFSGEHARLIASKERR